MRGETLFLAVNYLDRYLAAVAVDRDQPQLVSAPAPARNSCVNISTALADMHFYRLHFCSTLLPPAFLQPRNSCVRQHFYRLQFYCLHFNCLHFYCLHFYCLHFYSLHF